MTDDYLIAKFMGWGLLFVFIVWLILLTIKTAFGYFGFDFTWWQTLVIYAAAWILFKPVNLG